MSTTTNVLPGDDPEDAQLNALLQDNVALMNTMRANLLSGKFDDNFNPMGKFRDNCNTVVSTYAMELFCCWTRLLGGLPGCNSVVAGVCGQLGGHLQLDSAATDQTGHVAASGCHHGRPERLIEATKERW